MLNISKNSVSKNITSKKYSTLVEVEAKKSGKVLRNIIYIFLGLSILILLLPWTQNIRSKGKVSTLKPNQKPQNINSVIAGRIEHWYVQEGDFVNKGDTLLRISEVKDQYFDEQLIDRTADQLQLKKDKVEAYDQKFQTQEELLTILKDQRDLKLNQAYIKLQQAQLKQQIDSNAFEAANVNYTTALYQFNRIDSLYKKGLKSLTQVENRNVKLQKEKAFRISAKNKWLNSKNEIISLQIEINNIKTKYQSDFAKIQSEKFTTLSNKLETENSVSKLENTYSNYVFRNNLYYILAPQDGYVAKTISTGIGELIKEQENILSLMPRNYDLAVELYVKPIDLPLIKLGEKVRIQFDGWPAVVFSGWPNTSFGTFGGEIYAIDQYISANGKYRVLVQPDKDDRPWPDALRFGSGTSTMILLKDVQIWYELWRKINGFPPEYYEGSSSNTQTSKK